MSHTGRWTLTAALAALIVMVATPAAGMLKDLAGHWAGPLVGALEAQGIVSGDDGNRFNPEAPLSRAQLAKLMVISLGYQQDAELLQGYPSRFTDIPAWHWAKGYVESLAETGAVGGLPDGSFRPAETVSRAQLAVVLIRAAGLADQAYASRFGFSGYNDDADLPDWARGAVIVAGSTGLLQGAQEGRFLPNQPVTRAEAVLALFRLLEAKGQVFHLRGTLVKYNSSTLQGVVRDALGNEHSFTMAGQAQFFRGGLVARPGQIRPLDQVWIILGAGGQGIFVDAHYGDAVTSNPQVNGQALTVTQGDGQRRTYQVEPGALVFLNGEKAQLGQVGGATTAYLILNRETNEVRVLDAVKATVQGELTGGDLNKNLLFVRTEAEVKRLPVAPGATILLNGDKAVVSDLRAGDKILAVQNGDGAVTYLVAER